MDAALLYMMRSGGRNDLWANSMVNLEARKLINTANQLASLHIKDGMARMQFVNEITDIVKRQFAAARRAKTDEDCIACIKALRAEASSLEEQGRILSTNTAKLYAKIDFVRKNNKIVGYVITSVSLVISGITIIGGGIMIATMTPIGMLAGAILIVDGINGISREYGNLMSDSNSNSKGIVADKVVEFAQFMGFRPESGLSIYNTATLAASVYSIFGLALRPNTFRLFRALPQDFFRQIETISRSKLTMKIVGYGIRAHVIIDLLSTENDGN